MNRPKFPVYTPQDYILTEEDLAINSETRAPITVCVDCSFSMRQQHRLDRVMEGLDSFCRELTRNETACASVELCIVSYGGDMARVEQDFTPPDRVRLPKLVAEGETPLADAVKTALQNLEMRKRRYQDNGNTYYRPWLILMGDGDETMSAKELNEAAALLKTESDAKHLNVLCVTVGDEERMEYASLMKLAPDGRVHYLRDLKFKEFFSWLSRSIEKTTMSMQGEEVYYEPTTQWGDILGRT